MTPLPSEQKIHDHLNETFKLAAGKLQKIGEVFLAIRDPKRYGMLRPQGRNKWLQTTKNYPDAYARDGMGLHLVEATVGDWRKHIETEDAIRIPHLGKVGSYVMFSLKSAEALIPQANASEEKKTKNEEYYKDLLAQLGVPRDQIEFVFLDQLVSALRTPEYAWILRDIGLESDLSPFENLDDTVGANPGGPGVQDYEHENVICKKKLAQLYEELNDTRLLVLTGLGGVGKTTAALALAYRWSNTHPAGAYYLDVKWFSGAMGGSLREALLTMEYHRNSGTLFVIDNVHLLQDGEIARLVHCAQASSRSPLLLLGRNVPEQLLADLPARTRQNIRLYPLTVTPDDLLAAYTVFVRDATLAGSVPQPSHAQLLQWHRLAPDLVLFSASLRGAKARLMAGLLPDVSKAQAVEYFRTRYVANIPASERASLIVIAKLAELEIPASLRSFGGTNPSWLVKEELVSRSTADDGRSVRFALPHDNFGPLILESFTQEEIGAAWQTALSQDIFQTTYIAKRLIDLGRTAAAAEILSIYESRIWSFDDMFPPSFAHTVDKLYEHAGLAGADAGKALSLFEHFVARSTNFLAGARSYISFAQRYGVLPESFHRILLDQPSARLDVALRLASPVDFAYFVKLLQKNAVGSDCEQYLLVSSAEMLGVFLNKFREATLNEMDLALGMIRECDQTVYARLLGLRPQRVALGSAFEHLVGSASQTFDYFLHQQNLVEFLLIDGFSDLCSNRLAKGFTRLGRLIERADDTGPNTQAMLSDALQKAQAAGPIRGTGRTAADILYFVVKGARADAIVSAYIAGLSRNDLAGIMLHWPLRRLVSAWRSMEVHFPHTAAFAILHGAMLDTAWRKMKSNVDAGRYAPAAFMRYAWMCLKGEPASLAQIDATLRDHVASLSLRLAEMQGHERPEPTLIAALEASINALREQDNTA